jgi:hypothetical protein
VNSTCRDGHDLFLGDGRSPFGPLVPVSVPWLRCRDPDIQLFQPLSHVSSPTERAISRRGGASRTKSLECYANAGGLSWINEPTDSVQIRMARSQQSSRPAAVMVLYSEGWHRFCLPAKKEQTKLVAAESRWFRRCKGGDIPGSG